MKQKSDRQKLQEGRCLGEGKDYIGFIKANEAKSTGTAAEIFDPVADRTVDVLSRGEKEFFWIMRYRDDVIQIREQMMMNKEIIDSICAEKGYKAPQHILSTDFLVDLKNGKHVAYSIKSSRNEFDRYSNKYRLRPDRYRNLIMRQLIEKEYWEKHGIEFYIVFKEELNHAYAKNIETCMKFYKRETVFDEESLLKHLIAHKLLKLPMEKGDINFSALAKTMSNELEGWFHGEK